MKYFSRAIRASLLLSSNRVLPRLCSEFPLASFKGEHFGNTSPLDSDVSGQFVTHFFENRRTLLAGLFSLTHDFGQCPSSRFVFPRKRANIRHPAVNQQVKMYERGLMAIAGMASQRLLG